MREPQKMLRRAIARGGKWTAGHIAAALNWALRSRAEGRFGILMYHRIATRGNGMHPTWNVTPDRFALQLDGLLRRGYRFWPLQKMIGHVRSSLPAPPKVMVLTFDDGYASVFTNAFPALRVRNLPATVFLASAFVGGTDPFPFDDWKCVSRQHAREAWLPLTWQECLEMDRSGLIEIGTHSHTHQDFRGRPEALKRDLLLSIEEINRVLGSRPRSFSFPYGNTRLGFADDSLIQAARSAGVLCALNSEIGLNEPDCSPFQWRRIEAVQDDTGATLAAKLEGWYNWMDYARKAFCFLSQPELAGTRSDKVTQS